MSREVNRLKIIQDMEQRIKAPQRFLTMEYNGAEAFTDTHRLFADYENHYGYEMESDSKLAESLLSEKATRDYIRLCEIDKDALKGFFKEHRRNEDSKRPYTIKRGEMYFHFNAWYLQDAMKFTQSTTLFWNGEVRERCFTPLYMYDDLPARQIAIILPVNWTGEIEVGQEVL